MVVPIAWLDAAHARASGFTNPTCPLRVQRQAHEQASHRARSALTRQAKIGQRASGYLFQNNVVTDF